MGLHLVTSNGDLRKQYRSYEVDYGLAVTYDLEEPTSEFFPGDEFKALKSYENSEIDGALIARLLKNGQSKNVCFLPNIGEGEWFKRQDRYLGDQARNWFQIDIDDWTWDSVSIPSRRGHHSMTVEETARLVLGELGLPPDIEFVAQWSSSYGIKDGINIRIYVFLDKALDSAGLFEAFSAYDVDITLAEKSRLHLIRDPLLLDKGVQVFDAAGPRIAHQKGPLLEVAKLKRGSRPTPRYVKQGDTQSVQGSLLVDKVLKEIFNSEIAHLDFDSQDIYEALREHSENHPEQWKSNAAVFWFLRESLTRTGFFTEAEKFLEEAPNIKRGMSQRDIESKKRSILRYQKARFSCGDIRSHFKGEEHTVKRIHSFDMGQDYTDEELAQLPREGVLVFQSAEGTGKTELAARFFKSLNPDSSLSISYRKAVVSAMARDFKQTHYELIPGSEFASSKAEGKRLASTELHLATCLPSLHYILEGNQFMPRKVVFIDEVEHCLEQLTLDAGFAGYGSFDDEDDEAKKIDLYTMLSRNCRALFEVCLQAELVILADAKASSELTGWFIEQLDTYGQKKRFLLDNEADWLVEMTVGFMDSQAATLVKMKQVLAEGKTIAIQTSFADGKEGKTPVMKSWVRAIKEFCGLKDEEVASFIASDFQNDRDITIRNHPNEQIPILLDKGVKVIFCSPWNQVGWSYKGDGIDVTFGLYTNRFIHAEDIKQGLRRWRRTLEHYLYITGAKNFGMKGAVEPAYRRGHYVN